MEAAAPYTSRSTAPTVGVLAKPASRLLYIDNIRVFLTILVIVHHLMVIYAGSGSWIYNERREDEITKALGGWFCSVNQAYFMGLFLLISAYFVPGAYDRKGPRKFLADRFVRLGIPLVVYGWIIRPLLIYAGMRPDGSFWAWYTGEYFRVYGIIGGGPLWFIEALLLFSIVYALVRVLLRIQPAPPVQEPRFPSTRAIVLFALLIAFASFLARLIFPVNTTFVPFNLQFANFPQYIALFCAGLVAYRQNWFEGLPDHAGRHWLYSAILLVLIYPPMAILSGGAENVEPFLGGWHWQSLLLALWEAYLCISACIGLIYLFRRRFNRQGPAARELSRSAYTAYLIHEPVITIMAYLAAGVVFYPLLKFALASVIMVPLCFALSSLIRRLPYAQRVL